MLQKRGLLVVFVIMIVVGLSQVGQLWGQSEATTGTLRGTVTDPSGGVIPNAKVTLKHLETGYTRETTTGPDGYYNLPLLPVGLYELRVEAANFATTLQTNVPVNVGRVATLDVELKVGAAQEVVEVTAAIPLVETTRTQTSSVVDDAAVRELPIHGRNYLDFVLLTPGVVRDNNRAGDINFGGLKGTLNSLQIDGVDNNNNFFGQALGRTGVRAPFQFSQEAVAEFQVKTNSYSAEYGRAGGAVINVVTKTGTNELHGALFTFYRDNRLNANKWELNRLGRAKPPLRVWQFGAVAGGPIVRDKAFWLVNYDAQRRKEPNSIICPATSGAVAAACRAAAADSFLGPRIQDYQRLLDQDVFLGKVDWRITSNHNLSVRYNHQRFTGGSLENSGDLSVRDHTGDSLVRTHTLSGSLVSTLGSNWINEFRFQWGRDSEPGTANSTEPEAVLREAGTNFLLIGRNNFSPRETTINRGQFVDNVSYVRGKHSFRLGTDINLERILNFFPGLFSGSYTFFSLADLLDNRRPDAAAPLTGRYQQGFGGAGTSGPTTHPDITEYSWFVQDEYRATSNLTLSFGLRYDVQTNAKPSLFNPDPQLAARGVNTGQMNTDKNNFGSRLGFAWSPRFRRQWVVRGGYGIYYGRTPSIMTATATSQNGLQVLNLDVAGNLAFVPAYPNILAAPPTGAALATPNLYVFAGDYVQPSVQQGSLGMEVELAANWSVGASYLFVKGTHLSRSNDVNLSDPVPTTFPISTGGSMAVLRFPSTRPASNFRRITEFQSNANSIYHGAAFNLNKRFSYHVQLGVSYTLSKAIDDKPDFTAVVVGVDDSKLAANPKGLRDERGLSDQDFRHRFVARYVWELDYLNKHEKFFVRHALGHWSFSGILQAQNGKHYSSRLGGDPNNDTNSSTDRVSGFSRNTNTLPKQVSFDMRLGHDFPIYERARFQFLFEAFNLFNRPNFRDANSIQFNLSRASAATATTNCPVNTTCFFPQSIFGTFVGTYDHPGGGSANPGPGPRTLQLAVKFLW